MRLASLVPATFALLIVGGCAVRPWDVLTEASSAVSQTLCSKTFVSGLDPDSVYQSDLRTAPGMSMIAWATGYEVDRANRRVTTRIAGGFETRSGFNGGRGCTIDHGAAWAVTDLPDPQQAGAAGLSEIAGPEVVAPRSPALARALEGAFAEPASGPPRHTEAVVVLQGGQIIAERYAAGFGPRTPLLSRSLAKSVTNAVVGVLVRDGRLDVTQPAPLPAWRAASDQRRLITLEHLLRMTAGHGWDDGGGLSPSSRLWFLTPDAATAAAAVVPQSPPGQTYGYSSRAYLLAAHIAAQTIGGGPEAYDAFVRQEIFDPLGMRDATLEFDSAGTPMGGHAMLASARDWSRFGLLYLNDGVVGGRRILPEGWVAWSLTPTLDTGYGAGFWLNSRQGAPLSRVGVWGLKGAPADAFLARGYMGQYIVIIPSRDLVIVRFGSSRTPRGDIEGMERLVADILAATA